MAFLDQKEKRLGLGIVNGESEILASDWPSQFDFDQWPKLYGLQPTLYSKVSGGSGSMEPAALKQSLSFLQDIGLHISHLVTDR